MRLRPALALARCSHPGPVVGVTVAATGLALAAGRGAAGALLVAAAVVSGQLAVGWLNDRLDLDADRAAGRVEKPLVEGSVEPRVVTAGVVVAIAACIPLSLANGLIAGLVHLGAVAAALAYDAGLKRTPFSVLPYLYAFASLPAFATLGGAGGHPPPVWAVVAAGLAGAGAHFAQVLNDIDRERALGVRGLPQLAGRRTSGVIAGLLLLGAVGAVGLAGLGPMLSGGLALAGALVAVVVFAALAGRSRLAFRLTLAAGVLVVGVLLVSGVRL